MIPHHRKIALGPRCPACQTRLPFRATQLGLGTPFACGGCGQSLVVPRGQHLVFAVGLVVLFWLLKERLPGHWIATLGLFVAIALLGVGAIWAKTQVRLADPSDSKKPPRD